VEEGPFPVECFSLEMASSDRSDCLCLQTRLRGPVPFSLLRPAPPQCTGKCLPVATHVQEHTHMHTCTHTHTMGSDLPENKHVISVQHLRSTHILFCRENLPTVYKLFSEVNVSVCILMYNRHFLKCAHSTNKGAQKSKKSKRLKGQIFFPKP
jgi:hypothetical protein